MKRAYIIIPLFILLLVNCKYLKKEKVVLNEVDSLLVMPLSDTLPDTIPVYVPVVKDVYLLSEINDKYLIIIGSFKNLDYAVTHARKFGKLGLDTKVISKPDGFYMVSAQTLETRDAAYKEIAHFRQRYAKKSWVYENLRAIGR